MPDTVHPTRASPGADIQWPCVCDCGTQTLVYAFNLTNGGTVSCGCWRANPRVRAAATMKHPEDRQQAIAKLRKPRDESQEPAATPAQQLSVLLEQRVQSAGPPIWQGLADLPLDPDHQWPRESRKRCFLAAFSASGGHLSRAAIAANVSRRAHYRWLKTDDKYKRAFESAEMEASAVLEDEARRRAFEGVVEGVYYQGKLVGREMKYSDRLLVQLLKAHHPAHKPAYWLRGTSDQAAAPASFIRDETLAKLPEETVLDCVRVLREALDYVRRAIEGQDTVSHAG
ncbi:MAG: hypothetical protein ABSH24_20670 [Bryobacteraceae bacterium]